MPDPRPPTSAETAPARAGADPWGRLGALISRIAVERGYWVFPILFWTLLVGGSLLWNWHWQEQRTFDLAANQARQIASVIESVRGWNARHGGVYALVDEETRPNTYLDVPFRDIPGPGGKPLTMINSAYMTRQLGDLIRLGTGVTTHLTSLKPLNPANQPDPWETAALQGFENGERERIEEFGGTTPTFRYMKPLMTRQDCLQCHAKQGYKIGDVRGGLSISFSPAAFISMEDRAKRGIVAFHVGVWLALSLATLVILARLRHQILFLEDANVAQDRLVDVRTRELQVQVHERREAEERLQLLIDSSGQGILAVDGSGVCTLCNPIASESLGYRADELVGQPLRDLIAHSNPNGTPRNIHHCPLTAAYREGRPAHETDTVFWTANGFPLPVEYRARPIVSDGVLRGAVITFTDIGERKRNETRLRVLSAAIEHSPSAVAIVNSDGVMEYANPALATMTGHALETLLQQPLTMLCDDEIPSETYDGLWNTVRAGSTWHGELPAQRADGTAYWQMLSISPIGDAAGHTTHFVAMFQDVTELKRAQDAAWRQANYDALTGLPNRSLFFDRLTQHLAHARRRHEGLALLYLDLDGFKQINDGFGHDAGDMVLREAGERIAACLRSSDTVARLGGDEFAIVLPAAPSLGEAEFVAVRVIEALAAPLELDDEMGDISASIGIAIYAGGDETADELIRKADAAMYVAKREGGRVFHFYHEGMERNGISSNRKDERT
jgi:diguanylate cyclase (GGDEF)-like protein/PAS domain S-box-containing protein